MCGDSVEVLNGRRKRSATHVSSQTRVKREDSQLSDLDLELKSYGNNLRYECGLARRFLDEETSDHYDERVLTCAWNTTWTPLDYLDPCVWVQCLYPPQPPPESNMLLVWEVRSVLCLIVTELCLCCQGEPVNFTDSVAYVCAGEELYYEQDRDMAEYNVSCLPGGGWAEPELWPRCVHCEYIIARISHYCLLFQYSC